MTKIFKQLARHWAVCLVVFSLLFVHVKQVPTVQMSAFVKTVVIHRFIITPVATDAVPCVRLYLKNYGWINVVKMYLMHRIFMLYLQYRRS